jgi:hypothetical protein
VSELQANPRQFLLQQFNGAVMLCNAAFYVSQSASHPRARVEVIGEIMSGSYGIAERAIHLMPGP